MNLLTNCLIASALSLSTFTSDVIVLLKGDSFQITLDSELLATKFVSAAYDASSEQLNFITTEEVNTILVYEGENLEFVLPVMANRVSLGKSLFESENTYRLGFNFENSEPTYAAMVMN